jgi:hypothetical protein
MDTFVRSWHEFKNPFSVNVRLLTGDETWVNYFIPWGKKKKTGWNAVWTTEASPLRRSPIAQQ